MRRYIGKVMKGGLLRVNHLREEVLHPVQLVLVLNLIVFESKD